MAAVMQSLRLVARRCPSMPTVRQYPAKSIGTRRAFATTQLRRDEGGSKGAAPQEQPTKEELELRNDKLIESAIDRELRSQIKEFVNSGVIYEDPKTGDEAPVRRKRPKETFMNMGEEEPFEDEEDEEEDEDDIGTLAHGELEHHREMREYARLAAWDMPLLAKMAKPFEPPTTKEPLRFRYTSYMGEQHPAEKKVVLEFCPADMPNLTDMQREKLKKLVGVRYNPQTDIVRMSSEMFETQAQNKRYLGDLVDKLLKEARDPKDTFEDVPLDTRHHVFKTKPKFPKEWRMTKERRAEIEAHRQSLLEKDQQRALEGQLVDGVKQIQEVLSRPAPVKAELPEVVVAGKGVKGKPKRVAIRR